ncbi:MAG: NADH-quinone oxidoreductase subunit M [Pedosphaera parvula]|nr:NADH-quinone oxidoreductase subunit M [Verrucomicrobiota bacterium]MBI3191088.1 NADH-quinone oxidoreductase subunit M [Pedosphaera parvula]
MLAWTIYTSFLGVAVLMLLPKGNARAARTVGLLSALAGLVCAFGGALQFRPGPEIVTVAKVPWVASLGFEYHLAVDGISLTLVLLTGIAAVVGILFSWNVEHRAKEFFAFYMALIAGVYGVFLSFDLFLLFVFYELAIIPKYFLIAIWGSTRKEYGAMKLAIYSFVGSAMVLVGLVAAFVVAGGKTMSLVELAKFPFPASFQYWAFPLVFVGFGILAGLWPFHTWAPTGHVAAPTAASMLLAGVIMKLGSYGCLRVAMTLFPLGLREWQNEIGLLAGIGIVYGAMVALVQKDFKFVIGYSSVSHMGFVLLGLVTLNEIGLSGAVLQMFSHGIIAGLLFGVVGRMVYDRTHTRDFDDLEHLGLSKAIPYAAVTFVVAGVASMGLPGFSGFVAELQVLIGTWQVFPTYAVIAGVGILIGVAYTLRAMQRAFFTDTSVAAPVPANPHPLEPISVPERIGAAVLMLISLVIGLYPRLLLDIIVPSFGSPLFEGLRKGGLL